MNLDKSLYGMDVPEDELLIKTRWSEPLIPVPEKGIPTIKAAKELFIRSLPLVVTYLAVFSIRNAAMHYLRDQPDVTMISAVGIAFTFINIFTTALYISLNVGFMIKAADAYMSETYQNVGLLLHRAFIINVFASVPGIIVICLAGEICSLMGFESQICQHVGDFIYLCLPGVFLLMVFTTLTSYINACNKFSAPQLIQILIAMIFWVTAYVFAEVLDWGLQGIALSYNIMYIFAVIGIVLYLKINNPAPGTMFWFRRESFNFQAIGKLLKHQFYVGWTVYTECIVFEIVFLFCAALNTSEIIGYTIAYNNLPMLYILPTAFSDTMLAHIVGSIQERDISKAQKFLKVGFGLNLVSMAIVLGLYLGFIDQIAALYVTDDSTLEVASKALRLYSIIIIPDFLQMGLQSALKAIGKDRPATLLRNLCYYVVAVPLAYCLCYLVHLEILGLILGPLTGVTLMTIISIVIFWKTKWSDVIHIAVGEKLFDDTRSATEVDEKDAYQRSLSMPL